MNKGALLGLGVAVAGGLALAFGGGDKKKVGTGGGGGGGPGPVVEPPGPGPGPGVPPPVKAATCAAMQTQWAALLQSFGITSATLGPQHLVQHPEIAALQAAMNAIGCPFPAVGTTPGPIHTELKDCAFWQAELAAANKALNDALLAQDNAAATAAINRQTAAVGAIVNIAANGTPCPM